MPAAMLATWSALRLLANSRFPSNAAPTLCTHADLLRLIPQPPVAHLHSHGAPEPAQPGAQARIPEVRPGPGPQERRQTGLTAHLPPLVPLSVFPP